MLYLGQNGIDVGHDVREKAHRFLKFFRDQHSVGPVDVAAVARVADRIFSGRPTLAAIGPVDSLMSYDDLCDRLAP